MNAGSRFHSTRIDWHYTTWIVGYHLLALLAFVPWYFSWTAVVVCLVSYYAFGLLGINLCYHRLLAHRGLVCPKWLEHAMAVLAVCCVQDTPARWVAVHRRHHEHSDEPQDPHSPKAGFFWAHMGWLLVRHDDLDRFGIYERYAKDILRDRFYKRLERPLVSLGIIFASWLVYFLAGAGLALARGGSAADAFQLGMSLLVWGVFLRTVLVWHQTWIVNSIAHVWGPARYDTQDSSRNSVLVGLVSNGEGWHNNHHADPRSARHGHAWWEIDITYLTIRALAAAGLARNIVEPRLPRASTVTADPPLPAATEL